MSENLYTIEKILEKRYSESLKKWIYFVKWEGFTEAENTWEPEENLLPLGKMLGTFNKAWELKNKLQSSKSLKSIENTTKKPVVTKVKGLQEVNEPNGISKKPVEMSMSQAASILKESKLQVPSNEEKKTTGAPGTPKKNEATSSNGKVQETKTPQKKKSKSKVNEFAHEEGVKLMSKRTKEKNGVAKEVEIEVRKNVFRSCEVQKGVIGKDEPCRILGCKKRNNNVQYVVMFRGKLAVPAVVGHKELMEKCPQLLADYIIDSL